MNIEQTVSAAVAGLELGNTFALDDLLHTVQDRRHRRLRVVELAGLDTHDGLCALWLSTDAEDVVLHARSDSALHRQQFVLHELALPSPDLDAKARIGTLIDTLGWVTPRSR